jgi:hypothetical protein
LERPQVIRAAWTVDLREKENLMEDQLSFDLDGLAVDVFSLSENEAVVESLTGAHAMTEVAASCSCWSGGVGSCVSG